MKIAKKPPLTRGFLVSVLNKIDVLVAYILFVRYVLNDPDNVSIKR